MSATTTLKLPDALKERIARAAKATVQSAHAYMLEALRAQLDLAERRREFVASALEAETEIGVSRLVYDADDVFGYLRARIESRAAARPAARKLRG